MRNLLRFVLSLLCVCAIACGGSNTPLDADTRQAIDSISSLQMRQARIELDTQCATRRRTELPQLVDSIKKERIREIQQQLRTMPR
ncbi:MAG: hypothetical protein IT260_13775 [Saprospiraceae bacterium]|nr:hypothetical protein [Saprospiraceae bacterium]